MGTTRIGDLVIASEILQPAVKGAFAGIRALLGSPAASVAMNLPRDLVGGNTVKVPYFGTLGEADDIAVEGDALQPAKVTESNETATVQHSGKAFEATFWARLAADPMSDPYAEGARQIAEVIERRLDKALVDAACASLPAMTTTITRALDYDAIIAARALFGDNQNDFALMLMHSGALFELLKLKDSTGRPLITEVPVMDNPLAGPMGIDQLRLPNSPRTEYRMGGLPIYVSDRMPFVSGTYTTAILKRAALALWCNGEPVVKVGEDILANTDVTATHVYFAAYRYKRLPSSIYGGVALVQHT